MYYFKVRNFEQFQHYKHRNPPWIRLYYSLLHDRRFYRLDDPTKWLAVGCFLLASQSENKIPFDTEWIEKELALTTTPNWQSLIDSEFIVPIDCDASAMLAECKQNASQSISEQIIQNTEPEILSFSPKTSKGSIKEAIDVLNCWNSQAATIHHRQLNGQEKAIRKALQHYSPEEIKRAIERYGKILENAEGKYRNAYNWTLGEFLTRQNGYNLERLNAENWEAPFMKQESFNGHQQKEFELL